MILQMLMYSLETWFLCIMYLKTLEREKSTMKSSKMVYLTGVQQYTTIDIYARWAWQRPP